MPTFYLKRVWKDLTYEKMMLNINCDIIWVLASWLTLDSLTDAEQNRIEEELLKITFSKNRAIESLCPFCL